MINIPLSKRAGIFEAPPIMVKEIFEWARSQYCTKILSIVNSKIKNIETKEIPFYNIEVATYEDENGTKHKYSDEDDGKTPNDAVMPTSNYDILEYNWIKNECLKYVQVDKDIDLTNLNKPTTKVKKNFNINFSNWKYIKDEDEVALNNFCKKYPDGGLGRVTVILNIGSNHKFGGWWDRHNMELVINTYDDIAINIDALNNAIARIYQTTRHELQHLAQSFMFFFKRYISNDLRVKFQAGMPSKSIQNEDGNPKSKKEIMLGQEGGMPTDPTEPGRLHHNLRDIEFYTDLNDDIDRLKKFLIRIPPRLRMNVIKHWIDPKSDYNPELVKYINKNFLEFPSSAFFQNLLKWEPKKYRKAVIELLKEVKNELEVHTQNSDTSSYPLPPGKTKIFGSTVSSYVRSRAYELLAPIRGSNSWYNTPPEFAKKQYEFENQALNEYDSFINTLNSAQLLEHKRAVENGGEGYEYYVTDRWRQPFGVATPEPQRDKNGRTIVPPHPKLSKVNN